MVFRLGQTIDTVADINCFLGDLVLTSRDGIKNLFFLGADEKSKDKWIINFLLMRKAKKEKTDSDIFVVNSDTYLSYSGQISISINTNEKIHFSEDLGYYIMKEKKTGLLGKNIDRVYEFNSARSIKFKVIKKDEIVFDINFIES